MSVYSLTDLKKATYCLLKNRYVYISYTNGVGNNIFQYNFCYSLICKENNIKIINPFFINKSMNNIFNRIISRLIVHIHQLLKGFLPLISIIDNKTKCVPHSKVIFFGDTGEVLSAYEGKEDIIKKNFFKLNKSFLNSKKSEKNIKQIVIHFRLGDRLFYKTDYQKGMYYDLEKLQNILDNETKINNNKVSIFAVTDSPNIFEIRNTNDLNKLKTHTYIPKNKRVDSRITLEYIFKIKTFINFNNIKIINSTVISEDFSRMLNADILIFLHGTLSWWAAYLGTQAKVYTSQSWRPIKNANNPFLSNYKSESWYKW